VREDDTHPETAELLNDAAMRNGLSDHWRESYVWEAGKSMTRESCESCVVGGVSSGLA